MPGPLGYQTTMLAAGRELVKGESKAMRNGEPRMVHEEEIAPRSAKNSQFSVPHCVVGAAWYKPTSLHGAVHPPVEGNSSAGCWRAARREGNVHSDVKPWTH